MDLNKLKGQVPDSVINLLPVIQSKFGVNTPLRLAHFLAQCAHESGKFARVEEGLNYSADGLANTWPGRYGLKEGKVYVKIKVQQKDRSFRDRIKPNDLAIKLERKPQEIANNCYADRNGNGNEASGDGFKFRGRGYVQLTGRENYTKFSKFIGEDCAANPDLVATKYPLESAVFFFNDKKIWAVCDKGANDAVVASVTQLVNGGDKGLKERQEYFHRFYGLLNAPVPA